MALYIGLMSGTSLDGVDGVLVEIDDRSLSPTQCLAHAHAAFDTALRAELLALNTSGPDELHRSAMATIALMSCYAQVVEELLARSGCDRARVKAIGAHGQTVRHRPQSFGGPGYTIQLADGALLSEHCGIDCVCDFRSADVAAGGQGAPLVPAFHAARWSETDRDVALLNIGGIANLTLLPRSGEVTGFDTGPGNLLIDLWCSRQFGQPFDDAGRLAAAGRVDPALLSRLLDEPYFTRAPPKSTGRDLFDTAWLEARLGAAHTPMDPRDVLATLVELTACSAAQALRALSPAVDRLHVCGGGAKNLQLMRRLAAHLPGVSVDTTGDCGIPVDQVEATAFAWLAACRLGGRPASLPSVTGARGARVLGAIHSAPPTRT